MENNTITFDRLACLLKKNRSIRRFDNTKVPSEETLAEIVRLVRYCASGRNLQPLKYYFTNGAECDLIFPLLSWAGYYKDWDGPDPSQRPTAYIIQCLDTRIAKDCLCDDGLQLQAISLGATALGLGGCIIKSFDAGRLSEVLSLPDYAKPLYVYALGVPAEEAVITDIGEDGDIRYYRDCDDRQCVPKRRLADLLV